MVGVAAQFVDPGISRAKYERETAEFRALAHEYARRGWFLVGAEFPRATVLLTAPQVRPPAVVAAVAFDYTNYDAEPPSVRLVDPFTGEAIKAKDLPPHLQLNRGEQPLDLALPGMPQGARFQVGSVQPLMQAHNPEDVPFLCLAGVREYHEHPGHSGDTWELHRRSGAGRLVRLLEIIDKYGVRPINGYGVNLVPHITFQLGEPPQ